MTDKEVDLLVFGSGAAGLSVALFGEINRLKTLLCEKSSQLGGTIASSGGVVWMPGTTHARRAGSTDTIEKAREYLRHELGSTYRSDLADAFLQSAGPALDTLEANSDVKFRLLPWPDYHPDKPGGAEAGRTLECLEFDERKLGRDFELVRPPYRSVMLFGGMHINKRKLDDFLNPFRSIRTTGRVVRTLLRYGVDRLGYSRGTEIGAGNALVARLVYSLLRRKAEMWVSSPLESLIVEDGRVRGALVERNGKRARVLARHGVVLATGGFPHNLELRKELSADFPHEFSFGFEGNVGTGIMAGRDCGARIDRGLGSSGYWQRTGRRFVNESNSYHDVGMALHRAGHAQGNVFHFVCDRRFVWHHGLGRIRPFMPRRTRLTKQGYVTIADTIPELAAQIGVYPHGLAETVAKHNEYARTGHDPDFGKGSTSYNRLFGHPRASPNPNLAPIKDPPFYALGIMPGTLGTAVGLDTNAEGQVLREDGTPIPGLYACGNDGASVMRGHYPAGGITLGPAIAFAFRIAKHAAEPPQWHLRSPILWDIVV